MYARSRSSQLVVLASTFMLACDSQSSDPPDGSRADAASELARDAAADAALDAGLAPAEAGADSGPVALADPRFWQPLPPADDPFSDRPDAAVCPTDGTMFELLAGEPAFSVDTGICGYLTVTQPSRIDVAAGDRYAVRLWHFELKAPGPAEAHAALRLGDSVLLDERVPIPAAGGLLVHQGEFERAFPAGTPLYFHLHNHGDNSWSLVEVSVTH